VRPMIVQVLTSIRIGYDDQDEWLTFQGELAKKKREKDRQRKGLGLGKAVEQQLPCLDDSKEVVNYQQKIQPLDKLYAQLMEAEGTGLSGRMALEKAIGSRTRQKMIIIASLVDKAPNLGGLTRTCEIFNVEKLVVPDLKIANDKVFKSLAVTADKWMPMMQVTPHELPDYIKSLKLQGYRILALEQAARSHKLQDFVFPPRVAVLLGKEREGVPAELLNLVDECIEIPQLGIIRSLNVHVSGSILMWERTRQQLLQDTEVGQSRKRKIQADAAEI